MCSGSRGLAAGLRLVVKVTRVSGLVFNHVIRVTAQERGQESLLSVQGRERMDMAELGGKPWSFKVGGLADEVQLVNFQSRQDKRWRPCFRFGCVVS